MRHLPITLLVTSALALSACAFGDNSSADPLAAPTALTATAVDGAAHLQWADNATAETGYLVLRRLVDGEYAELATLPADATSHVDATVATGASYVYLVIVTGDGDETSSDEVAFTMP
jgi:hypothetical protein